MKKGFITSELYEFFYKNIFSTDQLWQISFSFC